MGICVVSSLFRLIFYYNCWNEHGWFLYGFEAPLIRIPNTFSMSTFGQNCINSNCFKQLQIIRSYSHLFDFPSFELMTTSLAGKGVEKWGEIFGRHGRRCRRLQRHRRCRRLQRWRGNSSVWPDWAIYWTLVNFLKKPLAKMNLSKSCAFLCIFCKSVKIYHFSIDFIFRQLLLTFGDFFLVTLKLFHLSNRREILPKSFFSLQKKFTEKHSLKNLGYWANSGLFLLIFDLSLIILLGTERLKTLAGFKLGFPE